MDVLYKEYKGFVITAFYVICNIQIIIEKEIITRPKHLQVIVHWLKC